MSSSCSTFSASCRRLGVRSCTESSLLTAGACAFSTAPGSDSELTKNRRSVSSAGCSENMKEAYQESRAEPLDCSAYIPKCLLRKARPDPLFKYASKRRAITLSGKQKYITTLQGKKHLVARLLPPLCSSILLLRSEVDPTYGVPLLSRKTYT